jgi:uncharacterized protein YbaP (TraB family)
MGAVDFLSDDDRRTIELVDRIYNHDPVQRSDARMPTCRGSLRANSVVDPVWADRSMSRGWECRSKHHGAVMPDSRRQSFLGAVMRATGLVSILATALLAGAPAEAAEEAVPASALAPALEVTAQTGARSVIVGTFHLDMPEVAHQIAANEVRSFDRLVVENSALPETSMQPGTGAAAASAATWLTATERDEVARRLTCLSINGEPLADGMVHLLATTGSTEMLSVLVMLPCGADISRLKDQQLVAAARTAGVPVDNLDTPDMRAGLLAQVPEGNATRELRIALGLDRADLYKRFFSAFNAGDYDAVLEISRSSYGPGYLEAMAEQRNLAWLPALESELKRGRVLVAVGAGHLGGPKGLITLLRGHGYTIVPISVAAETGSAVSGD